MIKNSHLAGALIAASFSLFANAADLEQAGAAQSQPALMKGYAVDVPARAALSQIVPDGWELFVHRQAVLPRSVSWRLDEPWPAVLARLGASSNLAIKIDWDNRAVFVRSPEVARSESGPAGIVGERSGGALPQPEQGAITLTGTTLSQALQRLQSIHKAPFSWEADGVGGLRIPAITFRGVSVQDDLTLLVRALGRNPPVAFLVHSQGPVVRVTQPSLAGEHVRVVDVPFEGPVHALATRTAPERPAAPGVAVTAAPSPAPAATPAVAAANATTGAPATFTVTVRRGEMLSQALDRFLRANGWNLVWKIGTDDDFENNGVDLRRQGGTVAEVLTKLNLPSMGLRAEVFAADKVVEITNTAPMAD